MMTDTKLLKVARTTKIVSEICNKKKKLDLANISGEYKRDVNDFEWLCRSCHIRKDQCLLKHLEEINKKHFKELKTVNLISKELNINRTTVKLNLKEIKERGLV